MDFLSKLGKSASDAANKAGNKAGELIEIGKLKGKISSQKQDISIAKKEMGDYCYELYQDGKIDDERLIEICEGIKAKYEEVERYEKQIEIVKDTYSSEEKVDPTL
ncbi:MAG: hypothetical protein GX663_00575 [Clostridiales bacterium]|nr:hypothetical protein [Clostridiales bacterium]